MESEKVKEIKKALEDHSIEKLKYQDGIKIKEIDFIDILTLINELESENENLSKAVIDNLDAYRDGFSEGANLKCKIENKWQEENQQLKDRIAELEDKIENGTLIELPYKLGTKLYFIVLNTFGGYFEIFETELWVYVSRYKDEFGRVDFAIEINDVDFDYETWVTAHCYSTKVEAEAKLKELQEKNND